MKSANSISTFAAAAPGTVHMHKRAFSLIEILVVVALLSVIILGLMAMFHQTQRALLGTTTQVDFLETGRATMDALQRDLQQLTPCNSTNVNAYNFYVIMEQGNSNGTHIPAVFFQPLADPTDARTNIMQSFFFVTCTNQYWTAIGYVLDRPDLGVASLYRTNISLMGSNYLNLGVSNVGAIPYALNDFINLATAATLNKTMPSNFSRIADGIVHLRVRAYTPNGILIDPLMSSQPKAFGKTINLGGSTTMGAVNDPVFGDTRYTADNDYAFNSNAVPAAIELELGVLEPRTYERFRVVTNDLSASAKFLAKRAGQVHVFKQRIPIRNVDPSAYQ